MSEGSFKVALNPMKHSHNSSLRWLAGASQRALIGELAENGGLRHTVLQLVKMSYLGLADEVFYVFLFV